MWNIKKSGVVLAGMVVTSMDLTRTTYAFSDAWPYIVELQ
jgi:hypothetical protein